MSPKNQVKNAALSIFCAGFLFGISAIYQNPELIVTGMAIGGLFGTVGSLRLIKALRNLDTKNSTVEKMSAQM